ncbi:hypothetical protein G6F50_016259 [Rhizopus delemar]|uniref:Oxidoreductase n=1 Tax=Rhizopus delemar TaxID=936053 RepID=A0A9P6XU99_9FUNG|nr:hypothetical protein G6F50_016259 [Rhizopus delemar]
MRPDLQLALIGYGLAGRVFHAPLIQHTPGLVLHSVVSSQRDTLLRTVSNVHVRATPQQRAAVFLAQGAVRVASAQAITLRY